MNVVAPTVLSRSGLTQRTISDTLFSKNSITLSTQKQSFLPFLSSTLDLKSNSRRARNDYIVHGL